MPRVRKPRPIPYKLPLEKREDLRRLPFDGTVNFRDIGGYRTQSGRTLRWGLLYRSDHLGKLTSADLDYIGKLGIKKITDFRGPAERESRPNRIPEGVFHEKRPIDVAGPDAWEKFEAYVKGKIDTDPKQYLHEVNRLFVTEYTAVYRDWLHDILENSEALPQVFHCTAGKDRTGFAAAVLMRILGVPYETVMRDYLKTNTYIAGKNEKLVWRIRAMSMFRIKADLIRSLMGVEKDYLETAFAAIDEHWGDLKKYIRKGLELSAADVVNLEHLLLE